MFQQANDGEESVAGKKQAGKKKPKKGKKKDEGGLDDPGQTGVCLSVLIDIFLDFEFIILTKF